MRCRRDCLGDAISRDQGRIEDNNKFEIGMKSLINKINVAC
jgi:hypothetical protein